MSEIIRSIEQKQLRTDLPKISIGDTVRVWVKVVEGSRERLQAFEGVVIAMRNGGIRETFTVRRVSYGIGVERTFPMHSPRVDHVEIITAVRFAVRSCTTCAICRARRPSSRKSSACKHLLHQRGCIPFGMQPLFIYLPAQKQRHILHRHASAFLYSSRNQ